MGMANAPFELCRVSALNQTILRLVEWNPLFIPAAPNSIRGTGPVGDCFQGLRVQRNSQVSKSRPGAPGKNRLVVELVNGP